MKNHVSDQERLFPDPDPALKGIPGPDPDPTLQAFPDPIPDPGQNITFVPHQIKFLLDIM